MKYIKSYENIEDKPQIGDYVICHETIDFSDIQSIIHDVINIVNNNIGQYVYNDEYDSKSKYNYLIKFNDVNIPENLKLEFLANDIEKCRRMSREEIIYWSKTKEELEIKLTQNKFNL